MNKTKNPFIKTTGVIIMAFIMFLYSQTEVPTKPVNKGKSHLSKEKVKPGSRKKPVKGDKSSKEKKKKEAEKELKRAEWIEKTIDYGVHKDRKDAINRILLIKNKKIKSRLEKKLIEVIKNESDSEVKVRAITVAGELKLKSAIPHLIVAIDDEQDEIRISAVYAIKRIGDRSAAGKLIKKLKEQELDKTSIFTESLITTLGEFKAEGLTQFAIKSIKDSATHRSIRQLLVLFLGKTGSKESKNFLIELLKDRDEETIIRAFAANSLSHLGIKEATGVIDKVITEIDSYSFKKKKKFYKLYLYCVAALVKLGDKKAFPRLLNTLRSDNARVRLRAIRLIKEIKDKRTIDILKYKAKHDPSSKVQKAAREALKEMGVSDKDKKEKKSKKPSKKKKSGKKKQ